MPGVKCWAALRAVEASLIRSQVASDMPWRWLTAAPFSGAARRSRLLPSGSHMPTPSAFLHAHTVPPLTPQACWTAC